MSASLQKTVAPAALDKADTSNQEPRLDSYPSVSSIAKTSEQRLAEAAERVGTQHENVPVTTVLYLAYGSNMCSKTFLGVRGIRPLSQINVSAPGLRLTFDLPGIPYREPCFANVGFRDLPEKTHDRQGEFVHQEMEWDGGLVGVVYEVTQEDYRTIMRTEGAGSSYQEIIVPCFPISPKETIPKGGPQRFHARTLYAAPTNRAEQPSQKKSWWRRLLDGRQRPNPDYAQASLRYLNLLRSGGKEHDLPHSYQSYLDSLHPYTVTRWSQTLGQIALVSLWAPSLIFYLVMARVLADETGKLPRWLARHVSISFNVMWWSYDVAFKPLFGDGERTENDIQDESEILLEKGISL